MKRNSPGRFRGAARLVDEHAAVGEAWMEGHIGSSQVAELSRTRGNTRVADRLGEFLPLLLDDAEHLPYADFQVAIQHFVNFADADGTHDDRDAIEHRAAHVVDVAGTLQVRAGGGTALESAEVTAIFDAFVTMARAAAAHTGVIEPAEPLVSVLAKLLVAWCEHPGCDLPVALCQVDHSIEWHELGRTDQDNAGVRCSGHNREKHRRRRRVRRSLDGRHHTIRPDGTIMLPARNRAAPLRSD